MYEHYDEDMPETLVVLDTKNVYHIMGGENTGKTFKDIIKVKENDDAQIENFTKIFDIALISNTKLVALVKKPVDTEMIKCI